MSHNFDNLGGLDRRAARRIVQTTSAVALAAAAALIASMTAAEASVREISASSYGFADALVANFIPERPPALPRFGGVGAHPCLANCGPAFGALLVRRSDLLTSNTADVSARTTNDGAGHAMGLGGMVVVERLEPDVSGSLMNWVVVSERMLDENGSHSWSLLSGASSDAPWRPNELYRFEGSSFSMDLAGEGARTPEASTWTMMLIGLAGLGFAGCRNSKIRRRTRKTRRLGQKTWRPTQFSERIPLR